MYRLASPPLSTRLIPPAPDTPHHTATRPFVSMQALEVLRRLPWFTAATDRYVLQPRGMCVDHTDRLQDLLVRQLCAQGQLELRHTGAPPRAAPFVIDDMAWRIRPFAIPTPYPSIDDPTNTPLMDAEQDPSADRIVGLTTAHGPVVITAHGALSPEQGGDVYSRHHALIVLQTFQHQGRHVAIAVDANDLQRNPVMDAVHEHAHGLGLIAQDLSVSEHRDAQRRLPPGLHIDQLPFRLLDLDSLVAVSQARCALPHDALTGEGVALQPRFPNAVRWATNAHVVGNPLPPDVADALQSLCEASPGLVERLDA